MTKLKIESEKIDNLLQLIDSIDKIDVEDEDMSTSKLIFPYSSGKRPQPKEWEKSSIQHKLL